MKLDFRSNCSKLEANSINNWNLMIYSMTAFARAQTKNALGDITLEIRSVNHRFLDLNFRLPENLRFLEPDLRVMLGRELQRGKVDVSMTFVPAVSETAHTVNQDYLKQLSATVDRIQHTIMNLAPINPLDLLKWPGVVAANSTSPDEVVDMVLKQFAKAVEILKQNREREGHALSEIILEKVRLCEAEVKQVAANAAELVNLLRQKMRDRIASLNMEMDPARLEQEIVLQAQRADVQEELDRLHTHLGEVASVLEKGGIVGRRLDFLMQELNREANTLGSKSMTVAVSSASVELKVLIEQMREQIQNIE